MATDKIVKDLFPSWAGKRDAAKGNEPDPPAPDLGDRILGATKRVEESAAKYSESYNKESDRQSEQRERQNNDYLRQIAENTKKD